MSGSLGLFIFYLSPPLVPLSDWIGHNQGHKLTRLHYFSSMLNLAPCPIVSAVLAGLAFINVAKFLEIVMRSQHRVGIDNHEQPVIWVLRHRMTSLKRNCRWGET
jgi:hypothetical protein